MHKYIPAFVLSTLCLLFLTAAKPLPDADVTTSDRPWVQEEEFAADDSLHAKHSQTVVLDLESSGKGKGAIRRNSVRFLVDAEEEQQKFSFCIPADEPHILRIKLKRSGGRTVINGRRGGACKPVRLEPGSYSLDVYHDGRSVGVAGKKAFLHRPARQRHRLSDSRGGTMQENLVHPNFFLMNAGKSSVTNQFFYGLSAPYGAIPPVPMLFKANGVLTSVHIWSFTAGSPTLAEYDNSRGLATWQKQSAWSDVIPAAIKMRCDKQTCPYPAPLTFVTDNCYPLSNNPNSNIWCTTGFIIDDQGEGNFKLSADMSDGMEIPTYAGNFDSTKTSFDLFFDNPGSSSAKPVEFQFMFKGYVDHTKMPPLQEGEYAVYDQCNFQGTAFVFNRTIDYSYFVNLNDETRPPDTVKSVMLGPSTFLEITKSGQDPINIGGDIECGSVPAKDRKFKIFTDALAFIAATNSCVNCNLTGLDFSGDDLTGVDFSGAILTDTNLTGTDFSGSNLTDAKLKAAVSGLNLTGTTFDGATLGCTSFSQADITQASFDNVVLTEDQSCYVDLSGATLNFDSFDVANWRLLDLSGAHVNDVPQVLSTKSAPLDLSGAILSNVEWLQGLQLDHVNLGCYAGIPDAGYVCPAPSGESHCATLQGTVLTGASLKYACMSSASMEGSFLGYSNLDGADLSSAQLKAVSNADGSGSNVTTLEGAFMRNVNLSGADLTGVTATNINLFYTGSAPEASAENLTAPGANFSNAYLVGVDFTGSDGTNADLQSTIWSGANLVGANFSNTDLGTNTSGGVNSGTNTTFSGAYLHDAQFDQAVLDNVNFSNTYWDALGLGGKLNFLMPAQNLEFTGYWKDISSPDCPPPSGWDPGNPPPMNVTDDHNTCPDNNPGPCDAVWGQPKQDISLAFFKSADATTEPPTYPQVPGVDPDDQCGGANNPKDLCWTHADDPPPSKCLPLTN